MASLHLPTPFDCILHLDGSRAVVRPIGELDVGTAGTLDARLREAVEGGARRIVLDLREVTFLGSTGLRVLLGWDAASRAEGFDLTIVRGPHLVQRVFELTGVSDRLRFVDG